MTQSLRGNLQKMAELLPSVGTSEFHMEEALVSTLVDPHGLPKGHCWASVCGYDGKHRGRFQKQVSFKRTSVSKLQGSAGALAGSLGAYMCLNIGSRHHVSGKQVQHCTDSYPLLSSPQTR